jgi:hypothetical protein
MPPETVPVVSLRREEIETARRMSIELKLTAGGDLFDAACEVTLSGIHAQNPGISRREALNILRKRLELGRRLEKRR